MSLLNSNSQGLEIQQYPGPACWSSTGSGGSQKSSSGYGDTPPSSNNPSGLNCRPNVSQQQNIKLCSSPVPTSRGMIFGPQQNQGGFAAPLLLDEELLLLGGGSQNNPESSQAQIHHLSQDGNAQSLRRFQQPRRYLNDTTQTRKHALASERMLFLSHLPSTRHNKHVNQVINHTYSLLVMTTECQDQKSRPRDRLDLALATCYDQARFWNMTKAEVCMREEDSALYVAKKGQKPANHQQQPGHGNLHIANHPEPLRVGFGIIGGPHTLCSNMGFQRTLDGRIFYS
ncbi:hypothetical protein Ciccas_008829 [Cichlidogyrus casuarinus]|uniref:Uncharacterized protein n=1 Tax=Cichlidogyrus casuarinus TaxID=1844966 RepID=A0ABD2PZ85_9PLAT